MRSAVIIIVACIKGVERGWVWCEDEVNLQLVVRQPSLLVETTVSFTWFTFEKQRGREFSNNFSLISTQGQCSVHNFKMAYYAIEDNNNNNFILCTKIQKVDSLPRQIPGKLVVAGQDKYMNNKTYLIKTKTFKSNFTVTQVKCS